MKYISFIAFVLFSCGSVPAQDQPHVDEIFKALDSNHDGLISKEEVVKSGRYARQHPRWDADKNGEASKLEVIKFRAKFGIAADGSRISNAPRRNSSPRSMKPLSEREFSIPDVANLKRVGEGTKLDRAVASNSQFVLKTTLHPVAGDKYFILTDHQDEDYLSSIQKLAEHHNATIISVEDLAILHQNAELFEKIRMQLRDGKVKFVAVAPRMESFRENMLLGIWELLSSIDEDPQLDCFPGILLASNSKSFSKLIDQSLDHVPVTPKSLKPFAINQVQSTRETRSLQKSGILRKHFKKANLETPIVAIYGQTADQAPRLEGEKIWNLKTQSRGDFVKELPPAAGQAFDESNLVVMHGHGIPGMSCSLDVDGLADDMSGKVLLSGSCFSASPMKSDLPAMGRAPGGYDVQPRDAFIVRAVDNGAIVAFGHQRLSSGFPHLYPVLESWLRGQTVGQAYQQLINGLIDQSGITSGGFVISNKQKSSKRLPQMRLLYVVLGDPALQPLESQPLLK